MTYQIHEVTVCDDVIRTEVAMAYAMSLTPGNTQHNRAFIIGMEKPDAYNFFIHYLKVALEHGVTSDAVMFVDKNALLYTKDGLYPLTQAFWEHPAIDILTPCWGEPHADIAEIEDGRTGFMLVRMDALKKLEGPDYMLPAEVEVPRIFTDNDDDFRVKCRNAGLKWLEHGGVVCDYFHEAFTKAGAEVPT